MKRKVIVHKRNSHGKEILAYPGMILEQDEHSVLIEAAFNREMVALGLLTFMRGDRFLETYYFKRSYNIFTVYAGGSGALKGWYCNLARPAILEDGHIHADDLALDLVRLPDGRMQLLDADEFAALDLTQKERLSCLEALDALHWQIFNCEDPF